MRLFAVALLITLPWLNPFSPGPTAAVTPLLFAWVCAAGLLLLRASTRHEATRQDWVRMMAGAWMTAAGLSATIGLLQYFGATGWLGWWVNHTELGSAYGNLRQRNQFASLTSLGLVALLYLAAEHPHQASRQRALRWLGVVLAIAVLVMGIYPKPFTDVMDRSVIDLLKHVAASKLQ